MEQALKPPPVGQPSGVTTQSIDKSVTRSARRVPVSWAAAIYWAPVGVWGGDPPVDHIPYELWVIGRPGN